MPAVRECKFTDYVCRHMDNGVVCGYIKHHQQLNRFKNRLINLINRSVIREAIDELDEKIDFGMDETLLQVQLVPFRGGTKGIVFLGWGCHHHSDQAGVRQEVRAVAP